MTMSRNGTIMRPMVRNAAYRQAFERLDAVLAKNTRGNDDEKIDRLRRALFGELPEDPEPAAESLT
jgi:hypothetical protein